MDTKLLIAFILLTGLLACSKELMETFKGFERPSNFPNPEYHFNNNEITRAKFELGRKLFYEPRFSRDNTISCGTCHIQSAGFTHHGHDVSHGIDDLLGKRNSPPIMNLAWRKDFFWDGGVFDMDLQPVVPIMNPVEMDETIPNVIRKLEEHPEYPSLFNEAFGSPGIDTERIMKAFSQFMAMVISSNSKYDKVMRNEGAKFTDEEEKGYRLFQQHCGSCHKEPLFTDESFRNNGIGIGYNNDQGRYEVTLNEKDMYTFKVPSLRNLSYTSPYMHDGRFIKLDAVLDHYAESIRDTPNLDPLLRGNLPLSPEDKLFILAFLKTLDDPGFVTDKRFAEQ
ncbi:MAG: cytochrome-c peroxidase [Chitinophagaceae bacterium]|nr:cytochrome-c peroxidase [Chitinophagaceae bacterium]MCW5927689.1 cytochrome-c peroxidase [Chitinophagaceae bacterium]